MKHIVITLAVLLAAGGSAFASNKIFNGFGDKAVVKAQKSASKGMDFNVESEDSVNITYSTTDPEYDWSQFDSKKIKVRSSANGLMLESKEDKGTASSIVELPVDTDEAANFWFGIHINTSKIDGDKCFGIVFDYEDANNYKGLAIFKKQYSYFTVKGGTLSSVKTGPVKFQGNSFLLMMKRANGGLEFTLNNIEVCKLKRITISNPYLGVFITGKMTAVVPHFYWHEISPEDYEQSTTGN